MSKKAYYVVVFSIAVLFCCSSARSQVTGSFSGTVTDQSGAVVSGATVTATSQGTGVARSTKTDEVGHYAISLLPIGVYTLRVESQGFQPAEAKDVKLQVDENRELDFTLAPGTVSTSVEVSATEVAVETTNPTLGQVITSQQVAQLPLNGRDFVQLATLTPGTTQETSTASFFNGGPSSEVSARGTVSLSVGGSRVNSTDWLLDGSDNNELTSGGIAILSSIDSIEEFKVLTYNYSAEFGTRAGPTVLVTTKSGTNDFHGTLYEFFRNTSLDAKSFFATTTEKFNLNQFGGGIGGPLRKNKTFFFIDGEQKYQRHGIPFNGLVPSDAMRNGDFTNDAFGNPVPVGSVFNPNMTIIQNIKNPNGSTTTKTITTPFYCDASGNPLPVNPNGSQTPVAGGAACNKIPSALINPIGQAMMNLYPHANANNPALGYNFVNEPVRRLDETKFDIRVDHNFSTVDSLFARFSYDQASSYVPGGASGFAEQAPFASNQGILNHGRNVSIGETHVFSPTDVNQASIGYNRIFNYITSQGTDTCTASTIVPGGIPGANLNCSPTNQCSGSSCGLTSTQLDGGYWSLGDRGYSPFQGGTNVYSIADSFDMIRGKHDIHVGGALRFNQMNVRAVGFQDGYWVISGAWTGAPPADLLTGLSSIRIHDQNFNGDITGRRWLIFRPFVQDDWRVTSNLTLNLGLAWAIVPPVTENKGRLSNLIPTTGDLIVGGNGGITMQWSAFEPRIGLAWKVFGSDKTAIRAGYGIFHDSAWSMGAQGLWQNPPFAAESFGLQFGGCTTSTAYCAQAAQTQPPNVQTPNVGTGGFMGLSDGFPLITSPPGIANFQGNWTAENTDLKQGMVQQFNVNLERQLPGQVVLTVGYAGARSIHILNYGNNLNVGSPSACGTPGYTLGCGPGGSAFPPPYPEFVIQSINDYGKAKYNSLQIKAETKSSRYGLYALIGYTYSHTYDTGYTDGLGTPIGAPYFPLPAWNSLDWARSQINLDNNFTASVIYDLPFGRGKKFGNNWNAATNALLGNWEVTVIEKITSGFPVFLINSSNNSGVNFYNNGNNYNRPDQVCNPTTGFHQSLAEWFNTTCFAPAASGQLGNANRAPVTGPDFVNTDFSVIKRFALPWENMGLDFRAEIFNLFNHAQFGLPGIPGVPNDVSSSATFGKIFTTVNNPRLVQFALKLTF